MGEEAMSEEAMSYEAKWESQAEMLQNRLRKNRRRLRRWLRQEEVSCYRLYDHDIPEIPLAIDWYEGRLHLAEYKRRHPYTEEEHTIWLERMAAAAAAALEVPSERLFLKVRQRQKGRQQYERVGEEEERFVVKEAGHRFWVNLSDYLDTGLFLDHRPTRFLVEREAAGGRFLNLFAYTGAFTVYAAAGGATRTTSVDLSRTYLQWAQDNLELNGLWGRQHRLQQEDVFSFLRDKARQRERYELAVVDPPTFSNSKRMKGVLDLQRDHPWLLNRVLDLLVPGGVLYFSTNFRKFRLQISTLHHVGALHDLSLETIPPDFRDKTIHRCWRIVRD